LNSLAFRSLAARRGRTALSVVGIALGIAVLYASLATDAGIAASIDRTVRDLVGRADLRVEAFGPAGLGPDSLAAIEQAPGVTIAAPALQRRTYLVPAVDDPNAAPPPVTVLGIDPGPEASVHDLALAGGSPLSGADANEALISQTLATANGTAVGGTVTLPGPDEAPIDLTVVGILAGDGPIVGSAGRTVVLPLKTMQHLFDDPTVSRHRRGRGRDPRRRRDRDRDRPDQPAVRALVPGRRRGLAPWLDRRLPLHDRADRGGRAVRRRVPDLQHPVDDRDRAGP
jgi:ABC-type lipoprotein release transport system permease subunit